MKSTSLSAQLLNCTREAEALSVVRQNSEQEKRFSFLLSQAKSLRTLIEAGHEDSDGEESEYRSQFRNYILNGVKPEIRTYQGMESVDLSAGGALCPAEYQRELFQDAGTIEPLLDENTVRFFRTKTGNPLTLPTVDLTQMTSQIISQTSDFAPVANPTASKVTFNAFSYRVNPIAISTELEQDSWQPITDILKQCFSVAIANGVGAHLATGSGSGQPQGVVTGATDSGVTTPSGLIDESSLLGVYMALPRVHRANKKTAWLFSDAQYKLVRGIEDSNGRPLLNIVNDEEQLFGKRVLISPALSSQSKFCLANLSMYCVRFATDSVRIRRATQATGWAEQGTSLLTCTFRADGKLAQPASSVATAVFGTVGS
jgi:HK97 family phage major capsid protein